MSNIDHEIYTAFESELSGVATLLRRPEVDQSNIEPPLVVYDSASFPQQDLSGDRRKLYPIDVTITVVGNTGQSYSNSGEGEVDMTVDDVVDELDDFTPSASGGFKFTTVTLVAQSPPRASQDRVERSIVFRLGAYIGFPSVPLSGTGAELDINGFDLSITGWTISREIASHRAFTASGSGAYQIRYERPLGILRVRGEVVPTGSSTFFPAVNEIVSTGFDVLGTGAATFTEDVRYGPVWWTPLTADPAAPQRFVLEGRIENEDSPIFTGVLP